MGTQGRLHHRRRVLRPLPPSDAFARGVRGAPPPSTGGKGTLTPLPGQPTHRNHPEYPPEPYIWQFGHQNLTRSCPGGPCSPLWISFPQRRHGRPARPYTQLSRPGLVSPVVTCPGRVLLASSSRCPSPTRACRSSTEPAGRDGSTPRRNSVSAMYT